MSKTKFSSYAPVWGKALRRAVTVAAVSVVMVLPAAGDSLGDALAAAYRNSNLLEQNRALLRATDEGVQQAQSAMLPVVEFVAQALASTSGAPDYQVSLGLTASMTLYDFGRGELGVDVAREQILATRAGLIMVEQNVLLNAAQAYLDLFGTLQTVQLSRNNVGVINEQLRAAQERFELGDTTRTDVAIAQARLAAARSALSAAEGDAAVAREVYNLAVGRYPQGLSQPPRLPRLPSSLDAAQAIARQNHPAITQSQHMVAAADLNSQIAGRQRYGTVTGSLGAEARSRQVNGLAASQSSDLTATVRYGVTLYNGGRTNSIERQRIAQASAERSGLHQTVAVVQQAVAANWSRLSVARARLAASEVQINASRSAYEAVQAEAELGSRTTLDVLNSEQELQDARATRIVASTGVHQAAYALLESMGQLTVESLSLGIPTYDVDAYLVGVNGQGLPPQRSERGSRLDRILGRYRNN